MNHPPTIEINPFRYIPDYFKAEFRVDKNVLGWSDLGYEKPTKQIVISKRFNISKPSNMPMSTGNIIHELFQYRPIRTALVRDINKQCGYNEEPISWAEIIPETSPIYQPEYEEIIPGKDLRYHPDIITPNYVIDIKTTSWSLELKDSEGNFAWQKVAPDWLTQINGYMCHYNVKFGIILLIHIKFLNSTAKWENLMKKYSLTTTYFPSAAEFKDGKKRAIKLFDLIDNADLNDIPCPIALWACKPKNCPIAVREICKNPIIYENLQYNNECSVCGDKLYGDGQRPDGAKSGTAVYKRQGMIYCKDEKCEQACLDAWRVS